MNLPAFVSALLGLVVLLVACGGPDPTSTSHHCSYPSCHGNPQRNTHRSSHRHPCSDINSNAGPYSHSHAHAHSTANAGAHATHPSAQIYPRSNVRSHESHPWTLPE